jgi:TPR repeat protein
MHNISLGVMYYNGQGVPHDAKESFKWYMLAAEQIRTKTYAPSSEQLQ